MKKNTNSLLSSLWMIEDTFSASLYPYLISMLNGKKITEVKTEFPVIFHDFDNDQDIVPEQIESNSQYISVLSIKSAIFKYDQYCGPMGTRSMTRLLKEWEANDNIIGVVLDIDSGGGQADGTGEFARFLYNYSKPISAYVDGNMCSAALYIAAACKGGIVANHYAGLFGSLGTMAKYINLDGIIKEYGGVVINAYSTRSPRKNEESRKIDADGDASLLIQNIIDPHRDVFAADMKEFRPDMADEVYDGAVYYPPQALLMGIIDKIGTIQDAFDKVIEMHDAGKKPQTSNLKSSNMNKERAQLQAVLGLDAPLAYNKDKGAYFNEDQLDSVEAKFGDLESSTAKLTQQLADEKQGRQADTQTANQNITSATTVVDGMLDAAALPKTGSLNDKLTALSAHMTEMHKKDGDKHTAPKTGAQNGPVTTIGGIDVAAGLNN